MTRKRGLEKEDEPEHGPDPKRTQLALVFRPAPAQPAATPARDSEDTGSEEKEEEARGKGEEVRASPTSEWNFLKDGKARAPTADEDESEVEDEEDSDESEEEEDEEDEEEQEDDSGPAMSVAAQSDAVDTGIRRGMTRYMNKLYSGNQGNKATFLNSIVNKFHKPIQRLMDQRLWPDGSDPMDWSRNVVTGLSYVVGEAQDEQDVNDALWHAIESRVGRIVPGMDYPIVLEDTRIARDHLIIEQSK